MTLNGDIDQVVVDDATVGELIEQAVRAHADRTALLDGASGGSVTYGELGRRIDRIAGWLHRDGLRAGERLALWAPNVPPVAAVSIAAMRLGAAVTGINPALTAHEAATQVDDCGATVIVTIPPLVDAARQLGVRRVVALGDSPLVVTLAELLAETAVPPAVDVDPDSVALLPYSSGTTGLPKGVMLSHRQVVTACRQIAARISADQRDITLAVAPWFHILGVTAELLVPLSVGATVVTMERFAPAAFVDLLERHRITFIVVPPPVAMVLATHPDVTDHDLGSLQLIASGGAPLPVRVQLALQARFPHAAVGQGWGLTETGGALCVPRRRGGAPPGTVGKPLPGTRLRVVDPDTGQQQPPGGDGELQAHGPQLMLGYLGRPDATAELFTADGWMRTGDLGHVDDNGDIVLVGRLKELIKVNAYQVAPAELEAVLVEHPTVVDAAVVGQPDARTGETPTAYVVVRGPVDPVELLDWVAARVAPYKRITAVHVVDQLPRTPSGKLLRRRLDRHTDTRTDTP